MKRRPLKKVNAQRRRALFRRNFHSEKRVRWIKGRDCDACGTPARLDDWAVGGHVNAHVKSRGAGGTYKDVVTLCVRCDRQAEHEGIHKFGDLMGVDFTERAREVESEWQAMR